MQPILAVSDWALRPLVQGLGSSGTTCSAPHPRSPAQSVHGELTASGSQVALPTQAQPQPQCPEQEPCPEPPGEASGRVERAVEGSPETGLALA